MQKIRLFHTQQHGGILILLLITLSTLLFLSLASIDRTVQHTRLLSNYKSYSEAFKNSERCLIKSIRKLPKLTDARSWSKNIKPPSQGLYNRDGQQPVNIKQFDWRADNIILSGKNCQTIIEYLGTISDKNPLLRSQHILRISILYQSRKNLRIILQATMSVFFKQKELPSIIFTQAPTLQQWIQLN